MNKKLELYSAEKQLLKENEALKQEIKQLRSRKRYGLVWEEKPEQVVELCKQKLPILVEDGSKVINENKGRPNNIIIEGDNYHALSVLNYTHARKIDIIYIDPPYNTGARDWKYNNDYVDKNDKWRHSKWIAMMHKRIVLAKRLLSNEGVIMIAIDDHEVHTLRLILDEIMGEKNYISTICIEVNPAGQNIRRNTPAISHDYCIIYARNIEKSVLNIRNLTEEEKSTFKEQDEKGSFLWDNLRRRGGNSTPKDRPGQWYPLYANYETGEIKLLKFENSVEIWPIDPKGIQRIWRVNPAGFIREYNDNNISIIKKAGRFEIVKKSYQPEGRKPKTIWKDGKYSATSHGTKLLINILGKNSFTYPKSVNAVKDCIALYSKTNSVILDFFAGSGTTGHAVLELNKEDRGTRNFILCTNNENNIATEVCYPRISNVIKGYKFNGTEVKGLGGNLKYFKTDFVDASPTDQNKKKLIDKSTEMLCLKESCFDFVKKGNNFAIFQNNEKRIGIVYDDDGIEAFKKEIEDKDDKYIVYVFSLDESAREEEFEEMKSIVELKPIPVAILNVYKDIFK